MIGSKVSHYKIIDKLGSGGMGVVYLAEDTKLERIVALKFLPEHLTSDIDSLERFKREAKAAAKMNHPNIITIHEINEIDGGFYISMEYVEGQSINKKLEITNKTLKISELIEYAIFTFLYPPSQ